MSQRVSKVGNIKYALSGDDEFVASVDSGETFVVECAINVNDGTIRHLGQQLTQADVSMPFVNGATGPIEVRGSNVGDMLNVAIVNSTAWASQRSGRASACFPTGYAARNSASRQGSSRSRTTLCIGMNTSSCR